MLVNGPIYQAVMRGISVAAASGPGDLLEVRSPADCILIPISAFITNEDIETSQQIGAELGQFATAGSGGTSVTPEKFNQHLQASQTTCLRNNTTDASGTEINFWRGGMNPLGNGWEWNGNGDIIVPISMSLVLGLATALNEDTVLSAGIKWMELGQ